LSCPGATGFQSTQSSTCGTHGTQSSACAVPAPSPRAAAPSAPATVAVPTIFFTFIGGLRSARLRCPQMSGTALACGLRQNPTTPSYFIQVTRLSGMSNTSFTAQYPPVLEIVLEGRVRAADRRAAPSSLPLTPRCIRVHNQNIHSKDRGCSFPRCPVPGCGCQVHHAECDWAANGHTDITDLTLACGPHNGLVKPGGWRTRKRRDGSTEWIPTAPGHRPNPHQPLPPPRALPARPRRRRETNDYRESGFRLSVHAGIQCVTDLRRAP
jgi:hypothetical protein